MWIETSSALTSDTDQKITAIIGERTDRQDTVWLNLSSGGKLVLAANGGWRTAAQSAFYALYVSPSGEVSDVSYGLLGGKVPFDSTRTGSGSSDERAKAAKAHLEEVLGVKRHRLNYGQIKPVSTI